MSIDPYEEPVGYRVFLEVRPSKLGGLGVFTRSDIKAEELIERAPVTLFPRSQLTQYDAVNGPCGLADYLFAWDLIPPDNSDDKSKLRTAFAHGFGSIYNHRFERNACYETHISSYATARRSIFFKDKGTRFLDQYPNVTFRAIKDIKAGTEITVSYMNFDDKDLMIDFFEKQRSKYIDAQDPLTPAPVESLNPLDRKRLELWEKLGQYGDAHLEEIVRKVLAFDAESQSKDRQVK